MKTLQGILHGTNSSSTDQQHHQLYGYDIVSEIDSPAPWCTHVGKLDDQYALIKVSRAYEHDAALATEARWFENSSAIISFLTHALRISYKISNIVLKAFYPGELPNQPAHAIYEYPGVDFESLITISELRKATVLDACTNARILHSLLSFYGALELSTFSPIYPIFSAKNYLISLQQQHIVYYNYSGTDQDLDANSIITTLAKFMFDWVPHTSNNGYLDLLQNFINHDYEDCITARKDLWQLMLELWGQNISEHPFTYYLRNDRKREWKQIAKTSDPFQK